MAAEFHINDSLSYMRFLGLEAGDKVPDGNTIWDFKEALKEHEVDRKLFDLFNEKYALRTASARVSALSCRS